jgi:hypothetical protein
MPALLTDLEATAITLSYLEQLDAIASLVAGALRDVWMNMSGYDREQLAEWIEQVSPLAQAGAAEGADLAAAYLAELTGVAPAGATLDFALPALDAPFLRHWHDLKEGQSWQDSVDGGASQAEAIGERSTRDGAGEQFDHPPKGVKIIGWQRVVQVDACEWCQTVATQMYRTRESGSQSHDHCKCIPPIAVTDENAKALRAINRTRLKELRRTGAVERVNKARERSRERERRARMV